MTISNDKQTWIFTNYGLNRIAQAMADSTVLVNLQKFKVGDANGEYYTPTADQTMLKDEKAVFNIHEKILNTTVTNQVTFKTIFTENSGGYEIREVGLYETINNVDYLFAVSTCQPMNRPLVSDGYDIAVYYNLNIISQNLASIYNQIVLDAQSTYVTSDDFDILRETVLWVEGNLMEQISANSEVLGLNRATQLYEQMQASVSTISNTISALTLSSIENFTDVSNVAAYWLFSQSNNKNNPNRIVDLGTNQYDLTLNTYANLLNNGYQSAAPYMDISGTTNYILKDDVDLNLLSNSTDSPFCAVFLFSNDTQNTDNTLLAKSNYYTGNHAFEFIKTSNNAIQINLFTDANNYISATTSNNSIPQGFTSVVVYYNGNPTNPQIYTYVNLTKTACTITSTGTYAGMKDITDMVTSYILDSTNTITKNVNSKLSLIALVKSTFTEAQVRAIALSITAFCGNNVCYLL
jgi:hypothetical protein